MFFVSTKFKFNHEFNLLIPTYRTLGRNQGLQRERNHVRCKVAVIQRVQDRHCKVMQCSGIEQTTAMPDKRAKPTPWESRKAENRGSNDDDVLESKGLLQQLAKY